MDIYHGGTNERKSRKTYNHRTNFDNTSSVSMLDKKIQEEYACTVKKNLDQKSKISSSEVTHISKFKKWYKMAYPEKYRSNKCGQNRMVMPRIVTPSMLFIAGPSSMRGICGEAFPINPSTTSVSRVAPKTGAAIWIPRSSTMAPSCSNA